MASKKIILLKITGEILINADRTLDNTRIKDIAHQIQQLRETHYFGIVIGGGNFFRGNKDGAALGINLPVGHQIGMLATMMNGLIIKDLFEQHGLPCSLFCAVPAPEVGIPISQQSIKSALAKGHCLIFSGGTGNPFFTTDTTAILRGLQIEAEEIWKGTHVDGIYTQDPNKYPNAQFIHQLKYQEALKNELGIMDATAFSLAKEHRLKIRVFNILTSQALINAAHNETFGSIVT